MPSCLDRLCWSLVLFRPDGGCDHCQGELATWSDGRDVFELCDLVGCCSDGRGRPCAAPAERRPATRAEVLRRHPDAPLAPYG